MSWLKECWERHPQWAIILIVTAFFLMLLLAVPWRQWRALVGAREEEPTPPPPLTEAQVEQQKDENCAALFGASDPLCTQRRRIQREDAQYFEAWRTCEGLFGDSQPRCQAIMDRWSAQRKADRKAGAR